MHADPPRAWHAIRLSQAATRTCVQIGRNVFDGTVQRAVWEALGIDTSKLSVITLYRFRRLRQPCACMLVGIESIYRPTLPVDHGLGLLSRWA